MNVRREPALILGVVSSALALLVMYGVLDEKQAAGWGAFITALVTALIPLVQAVVTRQFVMPVDTIKEAGLDPAVVLDRARDPETPRHVDPEEGA